MSADPANGTVSSRADLHAMRNRTFEEIALGDEASLQRTLTGEHIVLFRDAFR